ncbi:hypothetical protein ACQR35_01710 [Pseudarthrobacter sp. J1738]|uniref:hypothetical protein n=1 Tax=unclassified Pseudarthrobacter TaxID=2647000 RepID=UPI003D2E5168
MSTIEKHLASEDIHAEALNLSGQDYSGHGNSGHTVPTWPQLTPGQRVALRDVHGYLVTGIVDGMTADRSTLWLQLDNGLGRRLIHHLDGLSLHEPAVV